MKKILLIYLFLCTLFSTFAQTGPGGVGNNTSNLLWLEADDISALSDADRVSNWSDGSGNSNALSQPTTGFQPQYKTNVINGLPVVRFNQTNGRLRKTAFTSPTTAVTAIYVNANTEASDGIISYASTSNNNDFLLFGSENIGIYRGPNVNSGISSNDGSFHIINAGWRSSDGSTELWKDGSQSFTATHQTGTSITSGGSIALAGEQDGVDASYAVNQAHFGDFAEVMIFNFYLNEAQQIIVSNYLAAKYNLPISNDYYSHETTHGNNVAGIGRENVTNIHTEAQSDTILKIGNPSALDADQEYLLFGHDDEDITSWTTTEVPSIGANFERIAREWRIDETGDVGTVDFTIDVDKLPTLPVGLTTYALMVDSDGDFTSGAQVYELVLASGTEYEALGIEVADGDFISITALNRTIQHTLVNSNGFEPNNAVIEVSLNFIPESDITVDYITSDGTALVSQPDYTGIATTTLTILAGNSTATYTVNITNDVVVESSETFTITLSNPSAGITLGTNTIHTYTINDDDDSRKVYYDLASSFNLESSSPITIPVSINNIDGVNPTTVDYTVTGGTATGSGTDFTLAVGTVTIAAGSTTANISILINNDALFEADETIIIELSNPSNCNLDGALPLGGTGFITHTYTITNDDIAPEIGFDIIANSGLETATPVSIQVNLNTLSGVDATVNYTLTGTATGFGSDYTLANGTTTITSGNLNNTISLIIVDDIIDELNETVVLTLSTPVNATLGTNTGFTYTIVDNEEYGYLGPGGVGDDVTNKLWVKPEDLTVVTDATDITTWPDASGNAHDLSQSDASFKPRYYNNILNSQPIVRFDQANGRLVHTGFSEFPTTAITTYFVNNSNDSGEGLLSYASSGSLNNDYLLFNSSNLSTFIANSSANTSNNIRSNTWRIVNHTWRNSDGQNRIYINGTQTYTATHATGNTITAGGALALAGEQDAVNGGYASGQSYQGDFAEIIIYNTVLNTARKKIVDNYLSAKYNLGISSDMYSFDSPGNYEHEVAGIGRDDVSNFHDDAQGSAILRINTPSSLDDGDYLIWGHDDADFNFNATDVPFTVDNRVNRIWRADETGDIGTITINFDMTNFGVTDGSNLVLLIDTDDGLFTNASITTISSFSANTATFNNINLNSGDWFTIATLVSTNTLPVELIHFDATLLKAKVELTWTTASEINNDYFTIERTVDGINWQQLENVKGAGNSTVINHYSAIDNSPILGISYYRLKQTDFDGTVDYSKEKPIRFTNESTSTLKVYPNPFQNNIVIEGSEEELNELRILNLLGVNLINEIKISSVSNNRIVLDLSSLNNGTYIVKSTNSSQLIVKQ